MKLASLARLPTDTAARAVRTRDIALDIWLFVRLAARRFWFDNCTQAAASLAYTSLLAVVPLMTVMLGILSAFPAFEQVQDRVQALVFDTLVPQVGETLVDNIETFSERAASLTGAGVVGLIIASVVLLSTIEAAFNGIWRVRDERSIIVRVLSFWAILTMTPILIAASISATSQFLGDADISSEDPVWSFFLSFMPLLFQFLGFSLLYRLIPNCPVRTGDAMVGGAAAALLFEMGKNGFAFYIASFPTYETIYGALATVPIFLFWLYLAWSIILLGAVIAATFPDWRTGKLLGGAQAHSMLPSQRLTLALAVLREIWLAGRRAELLRRKAMLRTLPVSAPMLDDTLEMLRRHRFAVCTSDDSWVIARDLHDSSLLDLAHIFGLGIADPEKARLEPFGRLEGGWVEKVEEALRAMRDDQAERLNLPLADLIAVPGAGHRTTAPQTEEQNEEQTEEQAEEDKPGGDSRAA